METSNVKINLNHDFFNVGAFVQVFDKLSNNRKSFSKYGANLHCVSVRPDAHLKKNFFENIVMIEKLKVCMIHTVSV